jgi:hypothetical protein
MRSDKMVLFIDNIIDIREAFECMSSMARDDFIAIRVDDVNLKLIEMIVKTYENHMGPYEPKD